eukprot:TRINITY_DN17610_c0_g1_i2.p1 TRINITY_DN17610_c0_g1~~TRINITY_DN17610_c0_g1_i2.p1  ORF type:complete len:167 (+),score=60.87 TRINITY_DN17610_c0_g1_i2:74-502(+)
MLLRSRPLWGGALRCPRPLLQPPPPHPEIPGGPSGQAMRIFRARVPRESLPEIDRLLGKELMPVLKRAEKFAHGGIWRCHSKEPDDTLEIHIVFKTMAALEDFLDTESYRTEALPILEKVFDHAEGGLNTVHRQTFHLDKMM